MGQIRSLAIQRSADGPTPADLSPARHRLRQCIAAADRARREADSAVEPVHRLNEVIATEDRLMAELRQLYARDEEARGQWIAGGRDGPDPGDAADTSALNDRIVGMRAEVAAARRVLPPKEALHRAAVSRLQGAQSERAAALAEVAVEACEDASHQLTERLNAALAVEAKIRAVMAALNERASRGDPAAATAAGKILCIIRTARAAAGVPPEHDTGRRFLAALERDPIEALS